MAYIATSDVKAYGAIPDSDTVDDAELTLICARVQKWVESYTGRVFECDSDDNATRYYTYADDVDGRTLYLDNDLNTIQSVTIGTDAISDSDTTTSSDYVMEPRNDKPYYAMTLKANSPYDWTESTSDGDYENAIAVAGQWAYSSAAPADVQHACIRLVKWAYKQGRVTDETADRPIVLESGATVMPATIPRDVKEILDYYKDIEVF